MKPRLHPYVCEDNYQRVRAMAARPNETESSVVDKALSAFFASHHVDKRDAAIVRRRDRLTRQFDRLERNDLILNELTALFVRYYLTVTPPVPPSQMDAARAQGNARVERFVDHLGRDLRAGRRLLQRAGDELIADKTDFLTEAELDRLHQPAPETEASDA